MPLTSSSPKPIPFRPTNDFPFRLGDVVELITRQHEHGYSEIKITQGNRTTLIKSGETKMTAPVMVVVEVVREDNKTANLFDENTGKPTKDKFKIRCRWFSHQTGQFHDRWLNAGLLLKVQDLAETQKISQEINEIVILRTALFANRQTNEELRLALSTDDHHEGSNFNISRSFDTLGFLPPKMVVVGASKRQQMQPLFEKETGTPKRLLSEWQVKCLWYDYRTGKFSENELSPDTLMRVADLPGEQEIIEKNIHSVVLKT